VKLLERQNVSLYLGLSVVKALWPRGLSKSRKVYSTLTIFLTSPEAANRVIDRGLVKGGEVKLVKRFVLGYGLV